MTDTTRSPYVAVPRDLDSNPAFTDLSRDAQWLLQHLARNPYRLKCGVFTYNERLVARAAKAETPEVGEWWDELLRAGWIIEDLDTGEAWLTQHMTWDNTLANPNHAKAVQRDLKRIQSGRLRELVGRVLYARRPEMDPTDGIDPGWTEPTPDAVDDAMSNAIGDGVEGDTSNPRSPEPVTRSPEPDPRNPQPDPPDPDPQPAPGPRTGAQCEICEGTGIRYDERRSATACTCTEGRRALRVVS